MEGLIILLLLLLCVSTHPHGHEATSSYLSEVPSTRSAESIIALLHEHNVSAVYALGSDQFKASVLLENGICFDHCPSLVLCPRSVWDVSTAVAIARMHSIPTSVRSGGHGYNCESIKDGGMLIDVRSLKNLTIDLDTMLMHAEAGLRWKDVIPSLKRDCVITVHGQCTGVGVSGFSLHGGVHFGALSELYGLSADNLMGAIVVLPDGAVVDVIEEEQMEHMHMMTGGSSSVTTKRCSIKNTRLHRQLVHTQAIAYSYDEDMVYVDHTITPGNWSCSQLMEALRGAGSNVGVVVTLVLKLHPYPNKHCSRLDRYRLVDKAVPPDDGRIISSLAVVSVSVGEEEGGDVRAAYLLKALLAACPDAVSVTLFGLDAFFKAYMFVMRFADPAGQWKALGHSYRGWNMLSAVKNNSKHVIHFVVEATWLHSSTISIEELTSAVSVLLKRQEGRPTAALTVPFVQSPEPWSVPSYNLVWGKGHRYAGASLTVGPSGSECGHASNFSRAGHCKGDIALLVVLMEGFVSYRRSKGVCSDCVTVLHRVGEGIRRGGLDRGGGEGEGIFHPYRRSSVLWAEVDCGLFYRHDHRYRQSITSVDNGIVRRGSSAWDQCENWLGTVQSAMETAAAVGQRFHYINVPNKHSAQSAGDHDSSDGHSSQIIADTWVEMHISSLHFDRLRKLLDAIDPTGLFSNKSFVRTLPTSNTPLTALITSATTADTSVCVNLYRKHAFEDAVLAVKVSLALLLLRLSAAPAVHHLLKPMMQRLVAAAMR